MRLRIHNAETERINGGRVVEPKLSCQRECDGGPQGTGFRAIRAWELGRLLLEDVDARLCAVSP